MFIAMVEATLQTFLISERIKARFFASAAFSATWETPITFELDVGCDPDPIPHSGESKSL
jgi:hypothetical protein